MAKYTTTFTSNSSQLLCYVHVKRGLNAWIATISVRGTFGSGTIAFYFSPDSGVTLVPLDDLTGTVISTTVAGTFNVELGGGSHNDNMPRIYATLTGSTNPSIIVDIFDNR